MIWRTLAGIDEKNIEGVHPQFNQLVQRFGILRGAFFQEKVINELFFSQSTRDGWNNWQNGEGN